MKTFKTLCMVGILFSFAFIALSGCQSEAKSKGAVSPAAVDADIQQTSPAAQPAAQPEPAKVVKETPKNNVPVITIDEPVHDFGEMGPGARQKCEFKFKNSGTAPLKIERVQSTCGCTVPELKKKEYEPGEEGTISVSFTAPSVKTKTTKHLYIISNDPKTPRAELTIKAEVVVKVEVTPENVELRLDQENAGMPDLTVKSVDDKPFSIIGVTVSPQNVIQVPFDRDTKSSKIVLKPVVDMKKLGEMNTGVIQIRTNHPQSGTLVVRYHATPEYEVSRPRIILQNVQPGEAIIKDVLIRSNYDKDVEIASATSRNGYMEIASQEKEGKHLQLQIKITPPERNATSRRYITDELKITLTDGTVLSIRCSGWFKLQ